MSGRVLLVRHPPVARAWAGRCYGRADMGWSREGMAIATALVTALADEPITAVVHSGLRRTRMLAERVARRAGCVAVADERWRERDFARWEGRSWDAIWRETGDLMDRMLTHPTTFRPGDDGETGLELARRACAAWDDLPAGGTTLVVAHGGSIASVRGWLAGRSLEEAIRFVPDCGEIVRHPRG